MTETELDEDALPPHDDLFAEDELVENKLVENKLVENKLVENKLAEDDAADREHAEDDHADDVEPELDGIESEELESVKSKQDTNFRQPKERPPLKQIVEAILLAAAKPMSLEQLLELFDEHEQPDASEMQDALIELSRDCEERGYELKRIASGYRFQVRQHLAPWVSRLWDEKPPRYTRALLETLALIAYRQPITRGEIEDIRGVSVSSNIIRTLLEREWVRVVGHREAPGRPAMFATTRQFLDYFNLENLDELPTLTEIRDLEQQEQRLKEQQAAEAVAQASIPLEVMTDENGEVIADGEAQDGAEPASDEDSAAQLFAELDALEESLPDNFDDLIKRASRDTIEAAAGEPVEGELPLEGDEAVADDISDVDEEPDDISDVDEESDDVAGELSDADVVQTDEPSLDIAVSDESGAEDELSETGFLEDNDVKPDIEASATPDVDSDDI